MGTELERITASIAIVERKIMLLEGELKGLRFGLDALVSEAARLRTLSEGVTDADTAMLSCPDTKNDLMPNEVRSLADSARDGSN